MRTATSALLACLVWLAPLAGRAQEKPQTGAAAPNADASPADSAQRTPRFRSSVQMVSVAAVIRDPRGRFVRGLSRRDVEVLDKGRPREIRDFRMEADAPVSVALLFDESGSMSVSHKSIAAREAAAHVLAALQDGRDEVAVFAFDSRLRESEPFTSDIEGVKDRLLSPEPFGMTALFDAISTTAKAIGERKGRRKAIVVITDGMDTASQLRPEQVSGIASAIDVPVYVLAVVSPVDHVGEKTAVETRYESVQGDLANMSRWTGGDAFVASAPAHASVAAREIVSELRHQYLIAFEAGAEPGWHPLEVRVRERRATVRARAGYVVRTS